MKITKEYYVCDRCKEELLDKPIIEYDYGYSYELCLECDKQYKKYKDDIKKLDSKYDEVQQHYGFGKYLDYDGNGENK